MGKVMALASLSLLYDEVRSTHDNFAFNNNRYIDVQMQTLV